MLTRSAQSPSAQPTSPTARHTRRRLSAAGCALAAIAAILLPLAQPAGSAAAASGSGAWPWPLLGEVVTPYKNGSDPYAAGQHRGLDIAAPAGSPVLAIVGGRVSFSGRLPDGGETVTVRSSDGSWLVSSLHLSERAVTRGDLVGAGDALGKVGATGRRSVVRPHLHLSVRRADTRAYVDPLTLLGAQRLPAPAPGPAPAAPSVRAKPEAVSIKPLESRASGSRSVHAQSTGDATPAERHGAQSGTTASRDAAGAPAREGHAAGQAPGRVAPPPLKVHTQPAAEPARVVETRDPVRAATSAPASPSRWLLAAIAAVCLIALVLRRRPRSRKVAPTGSAPETSEREPAEVIAIARGRRSA